MVNWFLMAAAVFCVCGLALLALAMENHWRQVRSDQLLISTARKLKGLGSSALLISLVFCLAADHASMASLVWIMLLAVSSTVVALTFSWYPQVLSLLVAWIRKAD